MYLQYYESRYVLRSPVHQIGIPNMLPVTVIVPYHKGQKFLPRLDDTLRNQQAAEIVIVVDGGGGLDQVHEVLGDIPGAVVVSTPKALGTAGARNFGASKSTQKWLTFLDQDDWWPQHFLLDLFSSSPDGILAYDNELFVEKPDGSISPEGLTVFEKAKWERKSVSTDTSSLLLRGFPMVKLLIPRASFLRVGGFRSHIHAVEDFDLVWRLVAAGNEIRFSSFPRGSYLVRSGSITAAVARGNSSSELKARLSWIHIWTGVAAASALPPNVRLSALAMTLREVVRAFKAALKHLLRYLHQPSKE